MNKIDPSQVRIGARRRPVGDVTSLVASIKEIGLLHPITVTKDLLLVAGRHRLEACRQLGWKSVPANVVDLDDLHRELVEIDENLESSPLTTLERAEHHLRRKEIYEALHPEARPVAERGGPGRGKKTMADSATVSFAEDAAAKSGVAARTVREDVQIADQIAEDVRDLIRSSEVADRKTDLLNLARIDDKREQKAVAKKLVSGEAKNVAQAKRQIVAEKLAAKPSPKFSNACVMRGDAIALARVLADKPHLVVTDPPYGIETHRTREGGKDYADGNDYAPALLRSVFAALEPKLADDAHVYVFAGYTHVQTFKEILREFFDVQDNPIVWVKDNHTMCDFAKWYPSKHEYIIFAKKRGSQRPLAACVPDVLTFARETGTGHSAQKPVDLLRLLIEQSSVPGELVIDPFCGSGSAAVAAVGAKRSFVGFEIDENYARIAEARIAEVAA